MGKLRMLLCALAVSGACAGCADDLYVMSEHYEVLDDGELKLAGGGCMLALEGGVRGGGSGGSEQSDITRDFLVAEHMRADTFVVIIKSKSDELARRSYDGKFLATGERDEFSVTTLAGKHYELAYWGGHECDTSHLPMR
jgi:hypothetical protein